MNRKQIVYRALGIGFALACVSFTFTGCGEKADQIRELKKQVAQLEKEKAHLIELLEEQKNKNSKSLDELLSP